MKQNIEIRYWKGTYTDEYLDKPRTYVVESWNEKGFYFVGTVEITYREVFRAMDATHDLRHNPPSKFAREHASLKYPDVNPVIVMTFNEWEEIYGSITKYKRGDKVK